MIESDQTSMLINEEKHVGEIKYKTLLAEKILKHFSIKNIQTSKKVSTTMRSPVRGMVINY